jgi:hypothetical protein
MKILNTTTPYKVLDYEGIDYGVCRDFNHISRYRGLRQIVHCPSSEERFVALETPNPFTTTANVDFYDVPAHEENRLDIIAYKTLGDATYGWVIAYFNRISDGYSCPEGTRLMIPKSITVLFNKGEILQSVNPTTLNLGSE